ncbi:MFS transporter [Nonomuraea jabiensis]|uniref:MFS transporter n=1 Tax=Nonomuraea jabiensis TaxID=882448 RepID=UPI0036BF52F5
MASKAVPGLARESGFVALEPRCRRRLTHVLDQDETRSNSVIAHRAIALIVFATVTFVIVPEGLAVAWAAELGTGSDVAQGLIMAANSLGMTIGGLLLTRLLRRGTGTRLIHPLAVLAPLTLPPALLDPPLACVLLMVTVCGVVMSLLLPAAQALFNNVLSDEYRARAFGVMSGGMQVAQGVAILIVGTLSDRFLISAVVGTWCSIGVLLMVLVTIRPTSEPPRR